MHQRQIHLLLRPTLVLRRLQISLICLESVVEDRLTRFVLMIITFGTEYYNIERFLKQQWTDSHRPLLPRVTTFYNCKEILLPT